MAATTRERIAAAASEHGWTLENQRRGMDTWQRGSKLVMVEFTERGAVNYGSLRNRGAMRPLLRVEGTGKAEKVITILSEPANAWDR